MSRQTHDLANDQAKSSQIFWSYGSAVEVASCALTALVVREARFGLTLALHTLGPYVQLLDIFNEYRFPVCRYLVIMLVVIATPKG